MKKRNARQAHRAFLIAEVDRLAEHFRSEEEFRMEYGASARKPTMDQQEEWMR